MVDEQLLGEASIPPLHGAIVQHRLQRRQPELVASFPQVAHREPDANQRAGRRESLGPQEQLAVARHIALEQRDQPREIFVGRHEARAQLDRAPEIRRRALGLGRTAEAGQRVLP